MSLKKVVSAIGVAGVISASSFASANALFIAYEHGGFHGELVRIGHGTPSVIDVADDKTSSVKNYSGKHYSARNIVGPYASVEAFFVPNSASIADLGRANDTIDHFDVR